MSDLRSRFRSLDAIQAPYLWAAIEVRADAIRQPRPQVSPVQLLFVAGVLLLALLAAALSGGGGPRLGAVAPTQRPAGAACPLSSQATAAPANRSAAGGWVPTGSLRDPRELHAAVLLRGGCVLVVGGADVAVDEARILRTAEVYNPSTGTWAATGAMQQPRRLFTATRLLDGRVLVAGGDSGDGGDPALATAELFDPETGAWQATGLMRQARVSASAVLLPDGRVLVAGGWSGHLDATSSVELYDPATGTWSSPSTTSQVNGIGAILLRDGRALLWADAMQVYDAASETLEQWPRQADGYALGAPAVLPDGRVVFVGGGKLTGPGANGSSHVVLFDPAAGAWTAGPPTLKARLGIVSVVLGDGSVLLIGGRNGGAPGAEIFGDAERFDPATLSWAVAGTLTTPRSGHTATLLPDGRVLVVGGTNSGTEPGLALAQAELYLPNR